MAALVSICPETRPFVARFVSAHGMREYDILAWGCTQTGDHVALIHTDDPTKGFEVVDPNAPGFVAIYCPGPRVQGFADMDEIERRTASVRATLKP